MERENVVLSHKVGDRVLTFNQMVKYLKDVVRLFPDKRRGKNRIYTMEDTALGAFSVFFTQYPSFLSYQMSMEEVKGKSNAHTIFGIKDIPTDNHIRNLLDKVPYDRILPVFDLCFKGLHASNYLAEYRVIGGNILIALDGTGYFSSKAIHCKNCTIKHHKDGSITYSHSILTSVIVAPDKNKVIVLEPEHMLPQDGYEKQDCENAAAKRWIDKYGKKYGGMGVTILGDDLYSREPMCIKLRENGFNFILVCKRESHKTLYEWVDALEEGVERQSLVISLWNGRVREIYTYRYANDVPLKDGGGTSRVNWCELTIKDESGKVRYNNAFITMHKITNTNVGLVVSSGRSRWKTENESNNTLKTKGYYLEHNYGHGDNNLSSFLATLILLAFLFHTILDLMDSKYSLIRKRLPTRKRFFDDMKALMHYICFDNWEQLMDFMMTGLKLRLDSG